MFSLETIQLLHEKRFRRFEAYRQYWESEMFSIPCKILTASVNQLSIHKFYLQIRV